MRALDLGCGAGGTSVGLHRAGYRVTGVDQLEHLDYPFDLIVGSMLDIDLDGYDLVTAGPPCQRWSTSTRDPNRHPDLIAPVRARLQAWGGPYIIENVPQAPLLAPVRLCGSMFGLAVRRHRHFESNMTLTAPSCAHSGQTPVGVYGDHPDRPGGWLRPNGTRRGNKATSLREAQDAMGIDWMTSWDDLADAIPPAYAEYLARQCLTSRR